MLDVVLDPIEDLYGKFEYHLARLTVLTSQDTRNWFVQLLSDRLELDETSVALDQLYNRYSHEGKKPKETMAIAIRHFQKVYSEKQSLSVAFEGWFPLRDVALLETTMETLGPREALRLLTEQTKRNTSLSGKVMKGMLNGLMSFVPTVLMYLLLAYQPEFNYMVERYGASRPSFEALYFGFAEYWILVSAFLILLTGLYIFSLTQLIGPVRRWLDANVPFYAAHMSVKASLVLTLYGTMIKNKVIEATAFDQVTFLLCRRDPWLKDIMDRTKVNFHKVRLGTAFLKSETGFPGVETRLDIDFYASQEGFPEKVIEIADKAYEEAWRKLKNTVAIANVLMMALSGYMLVEAGFFIITIDPTKAVAP